MKNYLNITGFVAGSALLLSSCMSSTTLNVIKPADVDIPAEIATFAVVKRNEAPKGKKLAKRWEGFVSGEGIGTDKRSAGHASSGLILELSKSPRYTIKQAVVNEQLYGTGTSKMAEPLNWEEVEKICEANGSEALIVVEAFDSDMNRDMDSRDVTRKVDGGEVVEKVFSSSIRVKVHIAWRIYYPKEQRIIDVYNDETNLRRSGRGATETEARRDLPRTEDLVQKGAQELGVAYARRISPTHVTITRHYYGGGSTALKLGKTKMLSKDYDGAIDIWESEFRNTFESKIRKKTSFNIAVAYEAKADYENAIKWVKESISVGNKRAGSYLSLLEQRQEDEKRLKKQMEGKDD